MLFDYVAQAADGALNKLGIPHHLNLLGLGSQGEAHRDHGSFVHVQGDAVPQIFAKALGRDFEGVMSDGKLQQEVVSGVIGAGRARQSCLHLPDGHAGRWY